MVGADVFKPVHNPWTDIKKYDTVDHSHNWCVVKEAILKGEVPFEDALRGHNLSLVLAIQDTPASAIYNKTTGILVGGLPVEVFEEISKRAGFSWKQSFSVVDYVDRLKNETDDDWLDWATRHFDVADWFTITPKRTEKDLQFAYPFINNSPHLVTKLELKEETAWERYSACFSPFSPSLWAVTAGVFILSGLVYACIEGGSSDLPQETAVGGAGQAVFLTAGSFAGCGGIAPETPAGKLFLLSMSFFVMLVVTAYTADLASVMIVDRVPVSPVQSFDELVERNLTICMKKGTAFLQTIEERLRGVRLFLVNDEMEKFEAVRRGDCTAALAGQTWWDFESRMSQYNPGCKLAAVGRNIVDLRGSFVARAESKNCKEVVIEVMTFIMHEMYLDGFLEGIEDVYLEEAEDVFCAAQNAVVSTTMEPRHMSGGFLVHMLVSLLCLGIAKCSGHFGMPGCAPSGEE